MKLFYDAFKLAYPEAWARITRDLSPAQRGGLSRLPDTIHERCVYFLRMRQHHETRVAQKYQVPGMSGVRFEQIPDNS